jgi:hypothetical protein
MSRGDVTNSCCNETMRGQGNKRQCNNRPAQQEDKRAAWCLGARQCRDAPFDKREGMGLKPMEEGPVPLFLGCNASLHNPAMMGVEEEVDGGIGQTRLNNVTNAPQD